MKKYRKKPVVVEAIQYSPTRENYKTHGQEISDWSHESIIEHLDLDYLTASYIEIWTSEGVMTGQYGDWIIKGIKGEFYPCKSDIFEATYEEATA